ncbi:MAG: hypothetical protein ABEJ78_02300 [Haloferacaceae archaeon]
MIDLAAVVVLSFQAAILGTLIEALRRRDVAAAVNALVALLVGLLPVAVELASPGGSVAVGTALPLWLAVAGLLHSLGMLGLYDSTWWWDHVTHTVSASLVAALSYAAALAGVLSFELAPGVAAVATLAVTLLLGVGWELVELVSRHVAERYDVEPVLVHYGWADTGYDLLFDVVGAALVVAADLRIFVPLVERLSAAA